MLRFLPLVFAAALIAEAATLIPDSAATLETPVQRTPTRRLWLRLNMGAIPLENSVFFDGIYEKRLASQWSLVTGLGVGNGGGPKPLLNEARIGQRAYFARGLQGPFVGFEGVFAWRKAGTPLLFALPVKAGFVKRLGDQGLFVSGEVGVGPGNYHHPTPILVGAPGNTHYENSEFVVVVEAAAALGFRF
jgi:hypothetical protein